MNEIKRAITPAEKARVYQFRYKIYIEELNKRFLNYCDSSCQLYDALDEEADNFYYEHNGEIVGVLRCSISKINERLKAKFGVNNIDNNILLAQLDRFMVHKDFRKTNLSIFFINWIYKFGLKNNVQVALLEAEESLVGLYQRLGFKAYRTVDLDANKSIKRIQMYLHLNNQKYLMENKSIFLREFTKHSKYVEQVFAA